MGGSNVDTSQLMRWFSIGLGVWVAYHLYQAATKGKY